MSRPIEKFRKEVAVANIFRPLSWFRSGSDTDRGVQSGASPAPTRYDSDEPAGLQTEAPLRPASPSYSAQRPGRPVRERIEELAYRKWIDDGCPSGRDTEYWLAAEREILEAGSP